MTAGEGLKMPGGVEEGMRPLAEGSSCLSVPFQTGQWYKTTGSDCPTLAKCRVSVSHVFSLTVALADETDSYVLTSGNPTSTHTPTPGQD